MAVQLKSNMKVYDPRVQGGFRERIDYQIDAFNAASRGAIVLSANRKAGDFDHEAFLKRFASNIVRRRDTSSNDDVTPIATSQDEFIGVKMSRGLGPVDVARDAMVKAGIDFGSDAAAWAVGGWAAELATAERLNTAIASLRAALLSQAANKHSIYHASVPVKMTNGALIGGLRKMGDAANSIVALLMNSSAFFDLVEAQVVTDKVSGIADVVMFGGSPATLNKPVIITDTPALIVDGGSDLDKYYTIGLTAGAIEVEDTEEEFIHSDIVMGKQNLVYRLQGEYAYNIKLRGMKWDTGNGGENPNDAALTTGENWVKVVDSPKNLGGFLIEHNATA